MILIVSLAWYLCSAFFVCYCLLYSLLILTAPFAEMAWHVLMFGGRLLARDSRYRMRF